MIINARTNETHFDFNWNRGRAPQADQPNVQSMNTQSTGVSVQQLDAALAVVAPYLKGTF